ncbi:MAG: methyltransferase domain-containing protein [Chitinophagaceae bacterium]|nr:methyltransferase domain-containing protein [Chitinophagaceae bacterium]
MEQQLNDIREQQKETWNKFSPGWKKWDDFTMKFLKPMGDAIISELNIKESDVVLDAASGTGEPGLTIAAMVKSGKVTGIDVADKMLVLAKENAASKQLNNFETKTCDICELPFADNSYDKISCRMGFMFFPDMQLAANEMFRVLKPGGKMATSVWSTPDKNIWITGIMGVINKNMQLPPPPPGAPGMFRCGAPGFIRSIMEKSGFKNIKELPIIGKVVYENFDHMWQMMNDVAAPVVGAFGKADDDMKVKIKNESEQFCKQFQTSNGLELDYGALVISGEKP